MTNELTGHVALVAGATRGAGRGIAVQLGAAGATVYVTGRSSRRSGASPMSRPETIEETADLRRHWITAVALTPGFLRSEAVLDHFGVTEPTWRDAIATDPHFTASETPTYIGRAVVALAADPDVGIRSGQALSTGKLAREYGFTDADGTRPDWGSYFAALGSGSGSS